LFPKVSGRARFTLGAVAFTILAAGWVVTASGALPYWIRNAEARTEIEAAFFRLMSLPGGEVLFRRPPRETRPALSELIKKQPKDGELYSLRALEDEQQLDFAAAESDWKLYADNSSNKSAAQITLADFRVIDRVLLVAGDVIEPDSPEIVIAELKSEHTEERRDANTRADTDNPAPPRHRPRE